MKRHKKLTESQEDYLEAIYHIASSKQVARAKDIAARLKVNSSSVTGALRVLADKGLIHYAPYDVVTLTDEGKNIAEDVVRRHEVLRDFFERILGVDGIEADDAACQVEHAMTRSVLDKLIRFVGFIDICPRVGISWKEAFKNYCREGLRRENCVKCTFEALENLKVKRKKDIEEGGTTFKLHEIEPGQKAEIISVKARGEARKRIIDMGFVPGSLVEIEPAEASGDRVEVKIKGYHRSLRKDDAGKVIAEIL